VEENQVKHAENIEGTFERSYFKLSLRRTNLYSTNMGVFNSLLRFSRFTFKTYKTCYGAQARRFKMMYDNIISTLLWIFQTCLVKTVKRGHVMQNGANVRVNIRRLKLRGPKSHN
jgi:hypothetical protein